MTEASQHIYTLIYNKCTVPDVYFRYVDDTFCIFGRGTEACKVFSHLNKMHTSL